jgi:hypothetical protein
MYGGSYCEGFTDQNQVCNSFPCEFENNFKPAIFTTDSTLIQPKEVENLPGKVSSFDNCDKYCSPWSSWSSCGIKCGDEFRKQTRERNCLAINGPFHIDYLSDNFQKLA